MEFLFQLEDKKYRKKITMNLKRDKNLKKILKL
jgi:hypothetical protein